MGFFEKLFHKKSITLQDVFDALDGFSNDIKTLQNFSEIAYQYFGNNWKFNLEMYISSLPHVDKEKYLSEFKQVMDYEKALSIWTSALQIIKGIKPVSAELLKSIPEYKEYLSKFGIEGERLFEKLSAMFDIRKDVPSSLPSDNTTEQIEETKEEVVTGNDMPAENDEENNAKEEIITEDEEDNVDETEDSLQTSSVLGDNQEYHKRLKQRILEKVRDIEARKNIVDEDLSSDDSKEKTSKITEERTEIKEENEKIIENQSINNKKSSNDEENIDWILKNFVKISEFLSESRKIMSAISIYKKSPSLEEYKNYGFIIDVIDYLIDKGNEILSTKSDAEIEKVFPAGRSELISIIDSYKTEKNNEIVFAESDNNDTKKSE